VAQHTLVLVGAQRPAERRVVSRKAITIALFRLLFLLLSRQEVSKPEILGPLTVILFFREKTTACSSRATVTFGHIGSEWFQILGLHQAMGSDLNRGVEEKIDRTLISQLRDSPSYANRAELREAASLQRSTESSARSGPPRVPVCMKYSSR